MLFWSQNSKSSLVCPAASMGSARAQSPNVTMRRTEIPPDSWVPRSRRREVGGAPEVASPATGAVSEQMDGRPLVEGSWSFRRRSPSPSRKLVVIGVARDGPHDRRGRVVGRISGELLTTAPRRLFASSSTNVLEITGSVFLQCPCYREGSRPRVVRRPGGNSDEDHCRLGAGSRRGRVRVGAGSGAARPGNGLCRSAARGAVLGARFGCGLQRPGSGGRAGSGPCAASAGSGGPASRGPRPWRSGRDVRSADAVGDPELADVSRGTGDGVSGRRVGGVAAAVGSGSADVLGAVPERCIPSAGGGASGRRCGRTRPLRRSAVLPAA